MATARDPRVPLVVMPEPTIGLHRFSILVSASTLLLIAAGGLVTSTGSGLAVPDWPLSFGQVFPRMEGGVLFEHGHRLIASAVGLLIVVQAVWTHRVEPRRWARILAWALLAAVVVQGLLGGTTVLLRLPDAVSVAHAALAQLVFSVTVVLAVTTSPGYRALQTRPPEDAAGTRALALLTALIVFAQVVLGAVVRHTGAGLAIPDFPLAYGQLIPPLGSEAVRNHFLHRVGALATALAIGALTTRVLLRHRADRWLTVPAAILAAATAVQIALGALTIWSYRAVVPTTAHQTVGALVLGFSVLLAVLVHVHVRTGASKSAAGGLLVAGEVEA